MRELGEDPAMRRFRAEVCRGPHVRAHTQARENKTAWCDGDAVRGEHRRRASHGGAHTPRVRETGRLGMSVQGAVVTIYR